MLIGISGKYHSGKDTVFNKIHCNMPEAERLAFGDFLKEEVAGVCGVSVDEINKNKGFFRTMLQWWGTEFRRQRFGENYWVNKVEAAIFGKWRAALNNCAPRPPFVVITDVRFPNEFEFVKKNKGIMLRVERPEKRWWRRAWKWLKSQDPRTRHTSETALDKHAFDYVIRNDGDMEALELKVMLFCDWLQKQSLKQPR